MKKRTIAIILLAVALFLCGRSSGAEVTAPSTEGNSSTDQVHYIYVRELVFCETTITLGDQEFSGMELRQYLPSRREEVLEIPDKVMGKPVIAIGEKVFEGQENLTKVVLPSNLLAIGDLAFSDCINLTELELPDTVRKIGYRAFENCPGLKELRVTPDMELEYQALYWAVGLESVYMEDGVNHLNVSLEYNHSITYVRFPQDATELGVDPASSTGGMAILAGTNVRFFEVREGVTALGNEVFAHTELESLVLPSTLKTIGKDIFFSSENLTEVFFRGTEEQCLQTLKDQVAEREATLYYLSEEEPTQEGNFWHYVDGKPVIW